MGTDIHLFCEARKSVNGEEKWVNVDHYSIDHYSNEEKLEELSEKFRIVFWFDN